MSSVPGTSLDNSPAARELSPEEQQAENTLCYKLESNVVAALNEGRAALWRLAESLSDFDAHAGWERLGYDTKTEWLAQPEINLTQRTYRRLVRAWRVLHERYGVDQATLAGLEVSKVDIVLPAIESGAKNLADALSDVKALGARDLRTEYWGPEKPLDAVPEPAAAKDGPAPISDNLDLSGPVKASEVGTPVDAVLGEVVDGVVADPDADQAPEEPLRDLDAKAFIRCTHCGGIVDVEQAEKAEEPPV